VSTSGKLYTVYFEGSIDAPRIVIALKYIRRYLPGPVILVWDQLAAHKAATVREYLKSDTELEVVSLPPYCPELNPEEYCHGYVKERMRNHIAHDTEELLQMADREFNRLRRRPRLLYSFFAHAGIPIINQSG
jgi:transposase